MFVGCLMKNERTDGLAERQTVNERIDTLGREDGKSTFTRQQVENVSSVLFHKESCVNYRCRCYNYWLVCVKLGCRKAKK